MSNLSITKAEVKVISELLSSGGFDTADEAARAALEAAYELYEAKAKYVIVGQMHYSGKMDEKAPVIGYIKAEDPIATRVAFGPYATETQANNAQATLAFSTATHEEFRRWVLPIHHGTCAQWFIARKKAREEAEMKLRDNGRTRGLPDHMQPERPAA